MEKEVPFTMSEMKHYGVIQALLEKKMTAREAASALTVSHLHASALCQSEGGSQPVVGWLLACLPPPSG
ncbi:MAG: hypothetical protein JRI22_06650 [Deltaproteobacteria bacterium]|nr:hypothetical protein [Deltaproteobacteria bacterium]